MRVLVPTPPIIVTEIDRPDLPSSGSCASGNVRPVSDCYSEDIWLDFRDSKITGCMWELVHELCGVDDRVDLPHFGSYDEHHEDLAVTADGNVLDLCGVGEFVDNVDLDG